MTAGKPLSEAHKRKISEENRSRKLSEEHKYKMSLSRRGNHYALGHKHSKEARAKISQAKKQACPGTKESRPGIMGENGLIPLGRTSPKV